MIWLIVGGGWILGMVLTLVFLRGASANERGLRR